MAEWLTIAALAAQRAVSKQAVAKRVTRLVAAGALTVRTNVAGARLVDVVEFEKAIAATTYAVREANGRRRGSTSKRNGHRPARRATKAADDGGPVYAAQQARKVGIQADLAELELEKARGSLISVKEVNAAMDRAGETIVRAIDGLPSQAEDLAVAVGRDGVSGARTFLRTEARRIRDRVAQALRNLGVEQRASERPDRPGRGQSPVA